MGGRARARVERGERGGDLGWRVRGLVVVVVVAAVVVLLVGDSGWGERVVMSVVMVARAGAEMGLVLLVVFVVSAMAAFLWAVRVEVAAVGLVILFWAPKARVPWVWEERVAAVLRGFLGGMVCEVVSL